MPPRRAPRRPSVVPPLLAAAVALGACGSHAERDPRQAEREQVRDAAERAAPLATGDSNGAGPARDSQAKSRVSIGTGGHGDLVRGADPPLGPGDVRVTSTDGMFVLAVIGDTLRMRASDSLAAKVRREMAEKADTATGFGGLVARTVTGAVGGVMDVAARYAVRVPVAEVRDLRYEDGQIRFETGREGRRDRGGDGRHENGMSAQFSRADAERFIAAVRARQRALGVPAAGG